MSFMYIKFPTKTIFIRCANKCWYGKIDHEKGEQAAEEAEIPIFYSYPEAREAGWVFTKCERFSSDGKMVALCPDCGDKIC